MVVAHVSCYVDPAGRTPREMLDAWPTLTDVAAAASGEGVDVVVVQAATVNDLVQHGGVACHFVSDYRRAVYPPGRAVASRRPVRLVGKLRELRPDLVHFHGLGFIRQAEFIARSLGRVPILVQDHGDRPRRRRMIPFGSRSGADIAGVSFTSRDQAAPFVEAGQIAPDTPVFEVVESSSWFQPGDRDVARWETGLYGDPCVICVGRLVPTKDPLTVLRAARNAFGSLRDPHLWCYYGEAPLLAEVQRYIDGDSLLSETVHLMGQVPHERVQTVLQASDLFVSGSRQEGSGYAVIEAMACGTAPIVTDIPALRRITGKGKAGVLVPPGDAAAMGNALVTWNQRDRPALRQAVREHFERSLSFDAVGRDLRTAYRTLVSDS